MGSILMHPLLLLPPGAAMSWILPDCWPLQCDTIGSRSGSILVRELFATLGAKQTGKSGWLRVVSAVESALSESSLGMPLGFEVSAKAYL